MPCNSMNSPILCTLLCLFLAGCGQSDDQREFENRAFSEPQGVTQTSASGKVNPDYEDPDDWNISPMYEALVTVEPAFPNPVDANSIITLQINLQVPDAVNQMNFWSFRFPTPPYTPVAQPLDPSIIQTFNTISISASSITGGVGSASGLYRLLVLDGRDNVITYGDVRVK